MEELTTYSYKLKKYFNRAFEEHVKIIDNIPYENIFQFINLIKSAFVRNNKLMIFGNGGSAADSIHVASEFVNKMLKNRQALPAISLCTDPAILTAISNDLDYSQIFSRQIEAIGHYNDIAIGISTSGTSLNILNAFKICKDKNIRTVLFTGDENRIIDDENIGLIISVNSQITARIQEAHILYWHIICEMIEDDL
jgi:D-sedoheptulose 7-phosphate isomerase